MKNNTIALIYDFDGTLAPRNMQEYGFIQSAGLNVDDFWAQCKTMSERNNASGILCYMYMMLQVFKDKNITITKATLAKYGANVQFFEGVDTWFDLINEYGQTLGLDVHHYINSSGLKEMIEGTSIAHHFDNIFACSFLYNDRGNAYWPAVAVDYTTKTQFIFKINKGIREVSDNKKINEFIPEEERPIPFDKMIYIGDGETDIPCMKMVKLHGGHSIAVYGDLNKKSIATKLINENRVNFVCKADYRENSEIYNVVCRILDQIHANIELQRLK